MRLKKNRLWVPVLSACLLLLGGCAKPKAGSDLEVFQSTPEIVTPTPRPTAVPTVDIGGTDVRADVTELDLTQLEFLPEVLWENGRDLPLVERIDLGQIALEDWQLERIREAFPNAQLHWATELFGTVYPSDTTHLDLSDLTAEGLPEAVRALTRLPAVTLVELLPETGLTVLTPQEVDQLRAVRPEAEFHCCWELYGQLAGWNTRELRYSKAKIGNDGIEKFRGVLPYLYSLELLRLYNCGITNYDAMAELKQTYPEKNVVWSVEIAGYNFMTDTILFHCPLLRDHHTEKLKYLTDVIYLDIGHNRYITNVDFIKYLPKLQVVILSITKITDISPLTNCPDLEFVELLNTYVEDLSPLAELKKVEYLNIGDMPFVRDISPVYGMKSLKMVRICLRTYDHVKREQVEELKAALPDCFVSDGPGDPSTSGYWRFKDKNHTYTERYALLREQMLYDIPTWQDRQQNSPTRLEGDRER